MKAGRKGVAKEHGVYRRDGLFTMRMSGHERARLERLADRYGVSVAELIRRWMRAAEAAS